MPVGTLKSFDDLPAFVENLFVGVDKLQVLCDPCHAIKTAQDRKDIANNNKEECSHKTKESRKRK